MAMKEAAEKAGASEKAPKSGFAEAAQKTVRPVESDAADMNADRLLNALSVLEDLPADEQGRKVRIIPARATTEGYEISVAYMTEGEFVQFSAGAAPAEVVAAVDATPVTIARAKSVVSVTAGDPDSDEYEPFAVRRLSVEELKEQFRREAEETASLSGAEGTKTVEAQIKAGQLAAIRFVIRNETAEIASKNMSYAQPLDGREKVFERAGMLWVPLLNWAKRSLSEREDLATTVDSIIEVGMQKDVAVVKSSARKSRALQAA